MVKQQKMIKGPMFPRTEVRLVVDQTVSGSGAYKVPDV